MSTSAFSWVFDRSPMAGTGLVVHLILAEAVNPANGNVLCVNQSLLAERARATRGTVGRVLADLVARGLLEVVAKTPFEPNRYRLLMPDSYPVLTTPARP